MPGPRTRLPGVKPTHHEIEWVTPTEKSPVTRDDRPYVPQGNLRPLFSCRDPEILVEGPAGTGKSRALLELVNLRALKYPNSRHLLLRKTRASLTESILVTFEDKVIPHNSPITAGVGRMHRASYPYPNGSTIVVGGLDRPERTFSTEYDTVTVFEATECNENDWQLLFRALRNNQMGWGHQAIADCNPGHPMHWLNQRANINELTRIRTVHEDNPMLYNGKTGIWTTIGKQYILTLERLSGVRLQRLRYGKWVAAEGMVYEQYDPEVHVIPAFKPPDDWMRVISIDFGFVNPFVAQWWAMDHDNRMFLYREIYYSHRLVEDHAAHIATLNADEKARNAKFTIVSDHDAEDRATLQRYGVYTAPAQKDVSPGIQAVQERLRKQADGRPRLFIMRDITLETDPELREDKLPINTEQEFEGYMWEEPKPDRSPKEVPQKINDHGMDAMRYAAMYMERFAAPLEVKRIANESSGIDRLYNMGRRSHASVTGHHVMETLPNF